jgi:pyruvate dehydrogenase E2 component (dihydrolipoamide acetyltransferase)
MVPVIRDCDRKGFLEIADEMRALADNARDGALAVADMQGGLLHRLLARRRRWRRIHPDHQCARGGDPRRGRSGTEAVWDGAMFQPRLTLPISLSWDHRVVDGVTAAKFLGYIAALLSDFRRAVL